MTFKANKDHLGVVEGVFGENKPLLEGQVELFGQAPVQGVSLLLLVDVEADLRPGEKVVDATSHSLVKL